MEARHYVRSLGGGVAQIEEEAEGIRFLFLRLRRRRKILRLGPKGNIGVTVKSLIDGITINGNPLKCGKTTEALPGDKITLPGGAYLEVQPRQ